MLTRQLLRRSQTPSALIRALTTTAAVRQRTPALGDITPNGAAAFDQRQAEFRQRVRDAEQAKKEQDSQSSALASAASTAPTAPYNAVRGAAPSTTPDAGDTSDFSNVALGSLSTHDTEAARENAQKQESSKRKGALSSLIYGTHEGQQMDKEIEKSFSQVLARGKYVHSIVFHSVKPDKVNEYVKLVGDWYPNVANLPENHVNLVGSWRTEVGECDTFGENISPGRFSWVLLTALSSPYMGISTLPRLPRFSPLHSTTPRLSRLRQRASQAHIQQNFFINARILLLAHYSTETIRWSL